MRMDLAMLKDALSWKMTPSDPSSWRTYKFASEASVFNCTLFVTVIVVYVGALNVGKGSGWGASGKHSGVSADLASV